MNKIHHFVHLGYNMDENPEYEYSLWKRIQGIWKKIKSWVNEIIVLVDEWTKTIQDIYNEDIFRNAWIISDFLVTTYIWEKSNKKELAREILYKNCPREIIDNLYEFFEWKEKTIYRLLIQTKEIKESRTEINNIPMLWKLLWFLQEKWIIGDNINKIEEFEKLYIEALKYITRKYSTKNIIKDQIKFPTFNNEEFRKRINSIINSSIPKENVIQIFMQWEDTLDGLCFKWNLINPVSYMYWKAMWEYPQKYLDRLYMFQAQRKLRMNFEKLKHELENKWVELNNCEHILWGEYIHRCVYNYEWFLRWFAWIEKENITIDREIWLVYWDDDKMVSNKLKTLINKLTS